MTPELTFICLPPSPQAVVLVLHGGQVRSVAPTSAHQLAVLRIVPLAKAIAVASDGALAVARLRFTTRGWNGDGAAALADARWALAELSRRFGQAPIGIVGHSMGGRVALRVVDHPSVRIVLGLAAWLPPEEPVTYSAGTRVVLAHGDRDRTTSASASARRAEALRACGMPAGFVRVTGGGHAMLRRCRVWHELSAAVMCGGLLRDRRVDGAASALLAGAASVTV